jgi:serine/threonine-protein kinase
MALLKSLIKRDWFIGLVITLLFLIFAEAGVFSALDREAYNLGVKFSTAREPNEKIVVVAIDDKSLQTLGAWPWSRDVLAESMKLLTSTKPSVVGFTMPFDTAQYQAGLSSLSELRKLLKKQKKLSRSVNRVLRKTESTLHGDNNLAKTFKAGGRIVLSMQYIPSNKPVPGMTASLPKYMQKFALPKVSIDGNNGRGIGFPSPNVTRADELFPPIEMLARQVGGIGVMSFAEHFNSEPLIVQYGRDFLPSFALMLATRSKGMSMQHIESRTSVSPMLGGKDLGADIDFNIYPRFYGDRNGKPAFEVYSLIERVSQQDRYRRANLTAPCAAAPDAGRAVDIADAGDRAYGIEPVERRHLSPA